MVKKNLATILLFLVATFGAHAQSPAPSNPSIASTAIGNGSWVGSWASSQQVPESGNQAPPGDLHDATLRQIVHLSIGGPLIRLRISNAFGTAPLHLTAVHIAHPLSPSTSRIDPASDRVVTFNQRTDVLIPMGAEYLSDSIAYPVLPLIDLAITMQIESAPGQETGHPGSRATSYLAAGLPASAVELPTAHTADHWFFLSGVDVSATHESASIVVLGDSITDGHGATTNGNDRWTDDLSARLQQPAATNPATNRIAVLNQGIGGNRLLADGLGPNALARFDRDVLAQTGAHYLIILEGINDLGTLTRTGDATEGQHENLVREMIGAYEQMILRAHAHGIKVLGGTIMPFSGSAYYHPGPANERDRQMVNAWIRAAGHFDAVIDFDKIMADPGHSDRLRSDYDSGDHLHPSPAGYRAMADAVPLDLFQP
ncbi:secreted protein, putative [Acidisarcina polymorpha]|uniref:Secreted protein, putative n=1 Tax=Acidisarcina polymorpha TaxID=2211140 RepID=A0A2Z5G1Q3_9BACT|nr:secreted protein, putative [Acidisarcina polymorpha]